MKITRLAGLLGATALLATTAACGGSNGAGSPEDAAKGVLKAVADADSEAGCKLTLDGDKVRTDDEVKDCVKEADKTIDEGEEQGGIFGEEQQKMFKELVEKGPKNVGEEKDGKVDVVYDLEGIDITVSTKKVDGDWYVSEIG